MVFVPLNVHSEFSILSAFGSVEAIAKKAKAFGFTSVALTDYGNLYGAVEFYKACKELQIKPIIGATLYVARGSRFDKKKEYGVPVSDQIVLLAKDAEGYQNLCKLSSIGYLEGFYYTPRIDEEVLKQYSKGLICLSGSQYGRVAFEAIHGTKESLLNTVKGYQDLFKEDYYLELQRHQMSQQSLQAEGMYEESWLLQGYEEYIAKQQKVNSLLVEVAKELNIKIVATNNSHYIEREDFRAHEILLNIQSGEPVEIWQKDSLGNPKFRVLNPKRKVYPSHEYDFKSGEQMQELFSDLPDALVNTLEVADKCQLQLDFKTKHYPIYTPPLQEIHKCEDETHEQMVGKYLLKLCEEGIAKRYTKTKLDKIKEIYPDKDPLSVVKDRLQLEIDVIVPKGMSDYLLIVRDFIHWAKTHGIPMGPGRGSGAGSIILYLIGVTDIEPLRFHLFFERFINPERISYPDIDVDICMDRRGDVINYTLNKYGKENVAQIITFGTMKAKMTIKDVGRVLSVPLTKVNAIAKLVPDDLNITLEKALEKDQDLKAMYEEDEEAARIIDLGKRLEGSVRNTGIHAAGIIISGEPLTQFIPLCNAKDSEMPVTQYSMKPVELVGMLKVDFLGLKTLTAIKVCVDWIKADSGIEIDTVDLNLNDQKTFDLLNQGKTLGVFQLESGGMQDLAKQLHLDKFEEIIAVGALYRPGPMDMIPSFINRKHGREPIEYDHPWMQEILSETYGIMVYQEQVMQIASKLACYSLGEGDVLRRAMGKKDLEQMAKEREKFRLGALKNEIDEETSMRIFDKMEKFAQYGFNKSHAAAYGYLSYVTAYLKANFPSEWMAALMTCDSDDLTKVAKFIGECQSMKIPILLPDINEASDTFVATKKGIRFAMTGIKGIGKGVVEAIIQERKKGKFTSLYNFLTRIDTGKVHKKSVENLVDAGCFDFTGWSRDALKQSVDPMFESASKERYNSQIGVLSLFSLMGDNDEVHFKKEPAVKLKRTNLAILLKEKELLGFFLTGHPMDEYKEILQRLSSQALSSVQEMDHDAVFRTALIIEAVQIKISSKTEKKFAILNVSDGKDHSELPIWSELFEEKAHLLKENQLIYAVLQVDKKEENTRFSCKWLDDLTAVNENMIAACDLAFDKAKMQAQKFAKMKSAAKDEVKPKTMPVKNSPEKPKKIEESLLKLKLDVDKVRLSHILQIKQHFSEKRGSVPVQIEFLTGDRVVGNLQIDAKWGVLLDEDLQKKLKNIPSFIP